jgi:hypothetical protein
MIERRVDRAAIFAADARHAEHNSPRFRQINQPLTIGNSPYPYRTRVAQILPHVT